MRTVIALLFAGIAAASLVYADDDAATTTEAAAKSTTSEEKADEQPTPKGEGVEIEKQIKEEPEKVDWSKIDWRKRLSRLQYHIMREAGTERPFQNKFWDYFKPGQYRCAGCGLPLFESDAKFESDCGWPSFDKTIAKSAVTEHTDYKIGYARTEIRCRRCEAHLGHVFDDGPTKTGQRYCLNSAAMKFVNTKQLKEEKDPKAEKQADVKEAAEPAADQPAEK
jgi:methionine-R-sulfoxide reductase